MLPDPARRRRLALVAAAFALALLPRRALEQMPPVCPVRLATGYPCPTCGMTRSWHSTARLDGVRAVRYHPFGPAAFSVLAYGAWSQRNADAVATAAVRLPAGVKATALAAWLGWWAFQLAKTHRARGRRAS